MARSVLQSCVAVGSEKHRESGERTSWGEMPGKRLPDTRTMSDKSTLSNKSSGFIRQRLIDLLDLLDSVL